MKNVYRSQWLFWSTMIFFSPTAAKTTTKSNLGQIQITKDWWSTRMDPECKGQQVDTSNWNNSDVQTQNNLANNVIASCEMLCCDKWLPVLQWSPPFLLDPEVQQVRAYRAVQAYHPYPVVRPYPGFPLLPVLPTITIHHHWKSWVKKDARFLCIESFYSFNLWPSSGVIKSVEGFRFYEGVNHN